MLKAKPWRAHVLILILSLCTVVFPQNGRTPDELAKALLEAKTDQERGALLSREQGLLTVELRKSLNVIGEQHRRRGDYAQALTASSSTYDV